MVKLIPLFSILKKIKRRNRKNMKILFLDIDGVLNSTSSCIAYKGFGSPWRISSKNELKFSDVSMNILKRIIDEFDFHIVLSSTWRTSLTHEQFIHMMKLYDIDVSEHFLGFTPELDTIRGLEIQHFIDSNKLEMEDYIILDDDSDMTKIQKENHFIKVNGTYGLSSLEYQKIKQRVNQL